MMKANYHTHTTRCKRAKGTEREYVEANQLQLLKNVELVNPYKN